MNLSFKHAAEPFVHYCPRLENAYCVICEMSDGAFERMSATWGRPVYPQCTCGQVFSAWRLGDGSREKDHAPIAPEEKRQRCAVCQYRAFAADKAQQESVSDGAGRWD
jgi:hypothetical protein